MEQINGAFVSMSAIGVILALASCHTNILLESSVNEVRPCITKMMEGQVVKIYPSFLQDGEEMESSPVHAVLDREISNSYRDKAIALGSISNDLSRRQTEKAKASPIEININKPYEDGKIVSYTFENFLLPTVKGIFLTVGAYTVVKENGRVLTLSDIIQDYSNDTFLKYLRKELLSYISHSSQIYPAIDMTDIEASLTNDIMIASLQQSCGALQGNSIVLLYVSKVNYMQQTNIRDVNGQPLCICSLILPLEDIRSFMTEEAKQLASPCSDYSSLSGCGRTAKDNKCNK